ncbi:MAG: hypothetical protein WBV94_21725 [Blastocatellia bacterium]
MNYKLQGLGLRDKNGIEIRGGDKVNVKMWNGADFTGTVNYDAANACWNIDAQPIVALGRSKGTTLEVIDAPLAESKPMKGRRKGKPS